MPTFAFSCNAAFPNVIFPLLIISAPSDTIPNSSAVDEPVISPLFVRVFPVPAVV